MPFEYDLRGLDLDDFARETRALELVAQGEEGRAIALLRESALPGRLREAQWLLEQGYWYIVGRVTQVVRWIGP